MTPGSSEKERRDSGHAMTRDLLGDVLEVLRPALVPAEPAGEGDEQLG